MPLVPLETPNAVTVIGPLAADTDFQVRQGTVRFAVSNPGTNFNAGFERVAFSDRDSFFAASGKTVYVWTTEDHAMAYYGELA